MYRAKAHGKARYELFDQGMSAHGIERFQMENDMRRGLERNEFVLHYQPIVSLVSGQITGCEALLRWRHPERGLIMPGEFIPLAEESGLITALSEWVTLAACRQMSIWSRAGLGPLQLAINVSPLQFRQQNVLELVTRALAESEIDPSLLQLELTESSLLEDTDEVIQPLVELYGRGVQISLDDFGTGYSSLIYLQRFPISILKISESFIRHIVTSPSDAAIASGLIALAHSLALSVIVEGVETAEQLAFLQAKNCESVQGHIISPPLDAGKFVQFLKQWRGLSVPV
jgi:EAL domain-containing protein (putative c-di-GMP-specific phosphodiesterase class I)